MKKEELKELLIKDYINVFLAFSRSRTNSYDEAEDLSQQIIMECLEAIERNDNITNVNAYFWSIAHNTYKRYLRNRNNNYILDNNYCMMIAETNECGNDDRKNYVKIRESLSIISGIYRKVLVYFYYEELKIAEIAKQLNITVEMVKFYLSNGKKKLKEIYTMNKIYSEKSFNPSNFSIYYSGIDFSRVNIWNLFKRKLPCQIALVCYELPKTISEISILLGVSSCYLEDEMEILLDAGVIKEITKGKYQTNFFILNKEEVKKIRALFENMYEEYVNDVVDAFYKNLEQIKTSKVYLQDVDTNRLAWIFADKVADFDYRSITISENDYPKILSCGARALIYAEEEKSGLGVSGQTPTDVEGYRMWARDAKIFGSSRNQEILRNKFHVNTIIDVYNGKISDDLLEEYAYLLEQNLLEKKDGKLFANVAYVSDEFQSLMKEINLKMYERLEKTSMEIQKEVTKIVKHSLPKSLSEYEHGYAMTLIMFYAGSIFEEVLYSKGFIKIEKEEKNHSLLNYFIKNN